MGDEMGDEMDDEIDGQRDRWTTYSVYNFNTNIVVSIRHLRNDEYARAFQTAHTTADVKTQLLLSDCDLSVFKY